MGLVVPGFIPTPLGEIVEYSPSLNETLICLGIWAFGFLSYSVFLRMSVPILQGKLTKATENIPVHEALYRSESHLLGGAPSP
jgi:molybdopterin-containing oxidoreductase family membrane subunit